MTLHSKQHSATIMNECNRAGARAMLKGIGFTDDALARPIIVALVKEHIYGRG